MTAFGNLTNALDLAAVCGRSIDVFFRDDDAHDDVPNLRRLLNLFLKRGAPINLAVIPGTLTGAGADLLQRNQRCAPHLVELSQHGWMHINHEREGRKCEFGPSRGYARQLEDLAHGCAVMCAAFGGSWYRAFTPPWNRCTADTLRALDELGFAVLSNDGDEPAAAACGFRRIPVTFDIYGWKTGAALKRESEIAAGIAAQVLTRNRIGILLHHMVMTDDAFRTVATLLDTFLQSPAARLHTLRDLAKEPSWHHSRGAASPGF